MRHIIEDDSKIVIDVKDGSVITITTCCGKCHFIERASAGTKPVCKHPMILAKRPYSSGPDDDVYKHRGVSLDSIPEWCPLRTGGVQP
jgi:hypothetical protein